VLEMEKNKKISTILNKKSYLPCERQRTRKKCMILGYVTFPERCKR
jgi:hypothetical protein